MIHWYSLSFCLQLSILLVQDVRCTMYDVLHTMYDVQLMIYNIPCTVYDIWYTAYIVRRTINYVRCTIYDIRCNTYNNLLTMYLKHYTAEDVRRESKSTHMLVVNIYHNYTCRSYYLRSDLSLVFATNGQLVTGCRQVKCIVQCVLCSVLIDVSYTRIYN